MALYTNIKEALQNPQDVTHLNLRIDYGKTLTDELLACKHLRTLELTGHYYEVPDAFTQLKELEQITFRGRYNRFPEFIFGLPQLKHLCFEGYSMTNFPDKFHLLPQLLSLKISSSFVNNPYLKFPESIFSLTQLKQLYLYADMRNLHPKLGQLKQLEQFELSYSYSHQEAMETICSLTNLQTLILSNNGHNGQALHLPDSVGNLKRLKHLSLQNNHLPNLPRSLRKLTALETLQLSNGKFTQLSFQNGDLPKLTTLALEQNKQLNISSELQKFIASPIIDLNLKSNSLKQFPPVVLQFKQLQKLNLANNKIDHLPLDIVDLPELNQLNTTKTPLAHTTEAKSGKPINKLLALLRKNNSSQQFRKVNLALLLNDWQYLKEVTPQDILPALNTPQNVVRENALIALERHFPNSTEGLSAKPVVVTMIGKNKGLPINKTYQKLKEQGIQISRFLQTTTTHVVLGTEPGEKLGQAQDMQVAWVLPQHLRSYLQQIEVPYLMQEDQPQDPLQSLEELLLNKDPQNVALGLTMMLEGGIPEELLYDIVILALKKNYPPSQTAKKVLERYTSEEFRAVLRKHSRKSMVNILWAFQQERLIDQKKLALSALKFFKNEPNRYYYFNTLQRTAFELCFKQGGEVASLALEARIQEDALELTGFYIKEIPPELRQFNQLKHINLGGNGLRTLPGWFSEFAALEKLDLTNNMFNKNEKNYLRNSFPNVRILF
ncbi:MAG TPA: hypothetical protein DCS93_18675 [Microscillaceae bacterium]|nr:hypothetical protein [Microscillaceae bacterium]